MILPQKLNAKRIIFNQSPPLLSDRKYGQLHKLLPSGVSLVKYSFFVNKKKSPKTCYPKRKFYFDDFTKGFLVTSCSTAIEHGH